MSSKRLYLIFLAGLGLLFVGLIAGTYGTNKLLSNHADKLLALKAHSAALDQQQQDLIQAKRDIANYAELEHITKVVVPQEKNQAAAVREIVNIASLHGITVTSFTFPSSSLGGNGSAASSSAPAASAGSSSKAGTLSQLTPVKNIKGVYQLTIAVENDTAHPVTYDQFVSFLGDLEHDRHTAQVSTIELTPDPKNRNNLTFSLSLVEYVKP